MHQSGNHKNLINSMSLNQLVKFSRATAISIGLINIIVLGIYILVIWIEGISGYFFFPFSILFTSLYTLIILKIIRTTILSWKALWKIITMVFLTWLIYINVAFMITIIKNGVFYPCPFGANCP